MSRRSSVLAIPFLLLSAFGAIRSINAQQLSGWEHLDQLPGREITSFWKNDSVTCVQDSRGQLLISYDNGSTWTPKGVVVQNLSLGQNGSILLLSNRNELLYSSDNGRNFSRVANDLPIQNGYARLIGRGNYAYLIHANEAERRHFWRTSDGGVTWGEIDTTIVYIHDYDVSPDGALYLLAWGENTLMRYGADDNQWTTIPVDVADSDILSFMGFGRDGRLYAATYHGLLYRSEVGADALTRFAPDYHFLPPVVSDSQGELYLVESGGGNRIWHLSADGTDTTEIITPEGDGELLLTIGPHDEVYLTIVGNGCYRYNEASSGDVWEPVEIPGFGVVSKLHRSADGTLLTLTRDRAFLSSDNSGVNSFTELQFPSEVLPLYPNQYNLFLTDDGNVLLMLSSGTYRSTDFGVTWNRSGTTSVGGKVYRSDAGTLYAYGGAYTQRSTDDGATWNTVSGLVAVQQINSFGQHTYSIGPPTTRYSSDEGVTWNEEGIYASYGVIKTSTITPGGTFIGGFGLIGTAPFAPPQYVTHHLGDTGVALHPLPCDSLNTWYRFASDGTGRPYLVMPCGLYRSDDEGESWERIGDMPEGPQPTDLLITESGEFILGTNEGLYRAELTSSVGSLSDVIKSGATVQAIPNPVSGVGQIRFTLASGSHVRVTLYDALGREVVRVAEGSYEAGEHVISKNVLRGLSAGSYVLTIQTEGGSGSQNIVVLPE